MERINLSDRQIHVENYKKAVKQAIRSVKKENQITREEFYLAMGLRELKSFPKIKNGKITHFEWKLWENVRNKAKSMANTRENEIAEEKRNIAFSLLEHTF